jgi:hypothetical protein
MPIMIWNMIGRKDRQYRLKCPKEIKLLRKKMVPCFLPEVAAPKSEPFWVSMQKEMNRVSGDAEEKENILPFFQGYLFNTLFMVALQSIFYEVVAQPHKFDT